MNSSRLPLITFGLFLLNAPAQSAELIASNGLRHDYFGKSAALSGNTGLIGANDDDEGTKFSVGSAHLFRHLDTVTGKIIQNAKLTASDGADGDFFGGSCSISGNTGLIGAWGDGSGAGSAYLFRNLDTASGTVTQNAKLIASENDGPDFFGASTSISGNNALVGADGDDSYYKGSAYLFRNLDTASGSVAPSVKLTASDRGDGDHFGASSSLSENNGLMGASGKVSTGGAAYFFKNLDTAAGSITEHAKLTASDGAEADRFGCSVSLSGSSGLVGACEHDVGGKANGGAAYLFRSLGSVPGSLTQTAKLTASDGAENDAFGLSVSISGHHGLVGAAGDDSQRGAAYLFRHLDSASGTVTEQVKLFPSVRMAGERFGVSTALDSDLFVIGALLGPGAKPVSGHAYTGRVSVFTTLDNGKAARSTDGLSFIPQDDWIIGQNTDDNRLTLTAGDHGMINGSGKVVSIGQTGGADHNELTISGKLTASFVRIGAAGNTGNMLRIPGGGLVTVSGGVNVAAGSSLGGDGTLMGDASFAAGALFAFNIPASLTVTGRVSLPPDFGVLNLLGLNGSTPAGTYPLIDSATTDFATMGLSNWGQANVRSLGEDKSA